MQRNDESVVTCHVPIVRKFIHLTRTRFNSIAARRLHFLFSFAMCQFKFASFQFQNSLKVESSDSSLAMNQLHISFFLFFPTKINFKTTLHMFFATTFSSSRFVFTLFTYRLVIRLYEKHCCFL